MMGHHFSGLTQPPLGKPSDVFYTQTPPSDTSESSWCSACKCCTISLTATGFIMSLFAGVYFLFIEHSTAYLTFFLLCAIICLFLFMHVLTKDEHTSRSTSLPSEAGFFSNLVMPQSGRMGNTSGRARSAVTLPAYIVIPAEQVTSSGASTESTLSADEAQDEEAAGSSKKKAGLMALGGEELGAATETVVKVVDETLFGKGGIEEAGEGSSELSAQARRVLQSVRQRRQSPTEPQKPVPSSEGEKTK